MLAQLHTRRRVHASKQPASGLLSSLIMCVCTYIVMWMEETGICGQVGNNMFPAVLV